MKTAISAFATLLAFLLYGCTEKAAQSKQLYEMQDFNQGVRSVLDNEGFSIIEFWENASHLEPIPSEIEALHQAIDDGIKAQRSTAHLTADNKEKGTIQLRFWIIGDQVGAVKIDSPDEENSERIKAGLLSRFPDLTIMTENSLTVVQFEVGPDMDTPDEVIQEFSRLLESFSEKARQEWNDASERLFDIGYESHAPVRLRLKESTERMIENLNAVVRVTSYKPNDV